MKVVEVTDTHIEIQAYGISLRISETEEGKVFINCPNPVWVEGSACNSFFVQDQKVTKRKIKEDTINFTSSLRKN